MFQQEPNPYGIQEDNNEKARPCSPQNSRPFTHPIKPVIFVKSYLLFTFDPSQVLFLLTNVSAVPRKDCGADELITQVNPQNR